MVHVPLIFLFKKKTFDSKCIIFLLIFIKKIEKCANLKLLLGQFSGNWAINSLVISHKSLILQKQF